MSADEKLGEYRYFLLRAEDEDQARELAQSLAKGEEHEYRNVYGANVRWVLDGILNLKKLFDEEIGSGTEVYYEFFSPPDGE